MYPTGDIAMSRCSIKMGAYYMHERGWNRLDFGKLEEPDYQI